MDSNFVHGRIGDVLLAIYIVEQIKRWSNATPSVSQRHIWPEKKQMEWEKIQALLK